MLKATVNIENMTAKLDGSKEVLSVVRSEKRIRYRGTHCSRKGDGYQLYLLRPAFKSKQNNKHIGAFQRMYVDEVLGVNT